MTLKFETGQNILFDGDSTVNRRSVGNPDTWAYLRLMHWDKPWPDLLAEMLFAWHPELRLSFFNAASGGSTSQDLLDRLEANVLARRPDWVIATVAGNDVRRGIGPDAYRQTMTAYATRLTDAGAHVLLLGVGEHGPDYPNQGALPARRALYDVLSGIADATPGVAYADVGPALAANARLLREQYEAHTIYGDNGHFNALGHLMFAGEVLRLFGIVGRAGGSV